MLWMLDIDTIALNGWMYKLVLHYGDGDGHEYVTQNKVQQLYCHHTSTVMVVELPTTAEREKTAKLEFGSYFMRQNFHLYMQLNYALETCKPCCPLALLTTLCSVWTQ